MEVVPYWVMIPYGFVERIAILEFVCSLSGIKMKKLDLIIASLVGLFFTLAVRAVFPGNYFITTLFSIMSTIVIIYFFTGVTGVRVWMSTIIAMFIVAVVEFILYTYAFSSLLKIFSFISVWVLTGIPHVVVLLGGSLLIKKVKENYAVQEESLA